MFNKIVYALFNNTRISILSGLPPVSVIAMHCSNSVALHKIILAAVHSNWLTFVL